MPTFNFQLPDMSGDPAQIAEELRKLKSYILQLNEQLRYQFSHIDEENIVPGSITEESIDKALYRKIVDAAGNYSLFQQTANNILLQVSGLSNRNLIRNSDNPKTGTGSIPFPLDLALFKTLEGQILSLAVDVWDDTDGNHAVELCLMDQNGVIGTISEQFTITGTTTVIRPFFTQVMPNLDDSTELSLVVRAVSGSTGDFKANKPKAEKGKNPTEWTPAPGDMVNGLLTSTVLIDGTGVFVSGGEVWILAGGMLKLEGATVDIDTPQFSISLDGEERLVFDEDGNLAIMAGSVMSDKFIGNVVNTYNGNGALSIVAGASIYTALLPENIGRYLSVPLNVYVPAGTYNENITLEGFCGAGLTILLSSGAVVNGQWMIRNCSSVTIKRDGSGALPVLTGVTGDPVIVVSNVGFFHAENLDVRGIPRTTEQNSSISCFGIYGSRALIYNCDLKRALYGILAKAASAVFAKDNIGGISGSTDATTLALLLHGIYADEGSHVGVSGTVPFGGVSDADASDDSTLVGTGTGGGTGDPTIPDPPPAPPTAYASSAFYRCTMIDRRTGSSVDGGAISWGSYATNWGYVEWASSSMRQGSLVYSAVKTGTSGSTTYYRQDRHRWFAVWIFPAIADRANITAARLTITRSATTGPTGDAAVRVCKHDFSGMPQTSQERSRVIQMGVSVSLARGATATIPLDATTLAGLKSGAILGFGLGDEGSYLEMAAQATLEVDY